MNPEQLRTQQRIGCLILCATLISLVTGILIWSGVIDVSKSWGPRPWGDEAAEANGILDRFDAKNIPSVEDRQQAAKRIFSINYIEAIIPFQKKGLQDPDDSVRATVVDALSEYLNDYPNRLVGYNLLGMRVKNNVEIDMLKDLGVNDSSPEVRMAVAKFWNNTKEFSKEGTAHLRAMQESEKNPDVKNVIDGYLSE